MVVTQVFKSQPQLDSASHSRGLTVFTPPGIFIEAATFPMLTAGFLATPQPTEWLSIFDHPEAWRGLDREAILAMRRQLYRFVIPLNGREFEPRDSAEVLQTLALSVGPAALNVQAPDLPVLDIYPVEGLLPSGPEVKISLMEILSEPEISKVAQRITEMDIPASEAIWNLLDYDYTLDQVAQLMSVGLLGRLENRRMQPLRSAYKATIDSYVSRSIVELADCSQSEESRIYMTSLFGDSFTILSTPGWPKVDYLRIEQLPWGTTHGASFEGGRHTPTDPKTSIYADNARFSAYATMIGEESASHMTIFHLSRNARSNSLGPWISRAGVRETLQI